MAEIPRPCLQNHRRAPAAWGPPDCAGDGESLQEGETGLQLSGAPRPSPGSEPHAGCSVRPESLPASLSLSLSSQARPKGPPLGNHPDCLAPRPSSAGRPAGLRSCWAGAGVSFCGPRFAAPPSSALEEGLPSCASEGGQHQPGASPAVGAGGLCLAPPPALAAFANREPGTGAAGCNGEQWRSRVASGPATGRAARAGRGFALSLQPPGLRHHAFTPGAPGVGQPLSHPQWGHPPRSSCPPAGQRSARTPPGPSRTRGPAPMFPSGIIVPVIPPSEGSFEGSVRTKPVPGCHLAGASVQG